MESRCFTSIASHHLPPRLDMLEDSSSSVSKALYIQNCLRLDTCTSLQNLHKMAGSFMFQPTLFKNVSETLGSCLLFSIWSWFLVISIWIRFLSCLINLWNNFSNASWMQVYKPCVEFLWREQLSFRFHQKTFTFLKIQPKISHADWIQCSQR